MRIIALLVLLLAGPGRALAADGAALGIIGYSPDSRYFAFEQYGYGDASGLPYWEIFVIDLEANRWVEGTPVRILVEEDGASLAEARAKAHAAAAPVLRRWNVGEPAMLLAATPATEVTAERERLTFDRWYVSFGSRPKNGASQEVRHELAVAPVALPRPTSCPEEDGDTRGFTLTLRSLGTGATRMIHQDASIPASRGCPYGYDLAAVVAKAGFPEKDRLVAIVGVYAKGFEGADHSFIAVPFSVQD